MRAADDRRVLLPLSPTGSSMWLWPMTRLAPATSAPPPLLALHEQRLCYLNTLSAL